MAILRFRECIVLFLIAVTTFSTYMLHGRIGQNAPRKRIKRAALRPKDVPTKYILPSIAVAVPTRNRIGYVKLTSKALRGTVPTNDVWVFDDQSDEYSHKDLASWYGTEHVFISKQRLKADAMARHILEWFVKSRYSVLVLLDSDLVVAPDWLGSLHAGLRDSKGLLSLYRSGAPKHKSLRCGAVLCEQPSMGNAGTVWRRSIAEKMLAEMSNREGGFDWGWSEWCTKNRVPMQALKASAVLHIGMHGSWSHETTQEKSIGFPMNELTEDIRKKAEHFLKGAKPLGQIETWQSFENVWLPRYYQMAYANPEARTPNDLEKVKQTCIKLGCVAVSVEQNGWLAYFRNIPLDQTKWLPKRHATMWVMSKYLVSTTKQPDMKYGCSRHAHACRRDPEPGSAPCCAHVMLEIMSDMSRVLRKHNIHWRLTQGQQLSVARDGFVQLWDHDFDPNFDQPEKAKAVIEQEMYLAGKASKYREADYYYTKRVAERLNTDWSKYKVMGGDFDWNVKEFHDPYALQRNPTFMDIGQNHDAKPTAETTFPCLPGHDILCSKRWFEEVVAEFHSGYQRPSSGMPQEQIPYSGYVAGMNNLMFDENGHERNAQSRADTIRKYISVCPNFWEKPCLTSAKPQKSDILWVIPAFKRAWSLDLVLKSLTGKKILVSKDADSAEIDSVLKKYTADVISHPWSCSRHPNRFPAKDDTLNENYKGDTYGNPRSPWATCLKHHWWWMMKQAWARNPERVCVLEDDTVIHPQAFEWLARQSGNVKLTPEEIAVPWCMSAKEWHAIDPMTFCEHDDYNWDQTIAWMKEHGHGPNEASVPSVSLSMHMGDCGGWDAGGRDKACTSEQIVKIRANVEDWLGKPVAVNTIKKKWLTAHSKPNGGWGHPKDWAHCMGNDESKPFGMHFLERLEYYLPKRDYLFPTDVKSIEKKILTFDIPNRVSITFDAPVEKIAISTKNWPEKHKTQCPNCEFVNDRTATVKWVPGCPSNPRKDYKEQILVCSCGESQKGTGSSYFNSGIHQCDFDASFLNRDFQDSYTHFHLTPPQYKKILSVSDEMERYLEMPPMQEDKAVFIHSDCGHERGTFVSKMIQEGIFPIDRYGKCWRNKDIKTIEPSRENWYWGDSQGNRDTTKTDVFTNYKFSFALENTKSQDYFTEKRYQSFLALTVPIVWKNDNSEQYIPGENSVIYPEDHGNDSTELAEYLLRLTTDDKTYQKHMAWKKKGIRREFVKTLFKKTDFMACRICEKVSARQVSTGSKEYVVVMPSVKRNNDEYLIKTLDSLEKARPVDVPVLLVNANQPATKHAYLREWCSSHEKYKCINPPKVPESLIKDAISNDKRGDSEHFLRWRTIETEHALFGLREALELHTEYIIWIQDDVIVNKDLFASLVNDDIVCLRDGKDYCGAVAYLFSRKFVSELIPKIEANKLTMPIDWIIFDPRPPEAKFNVPKRIPLITHIGKKSTKQAIEQKSDVIITKTSHPYNMVLHEPPGIVSAELQKTGVWETGITKRFESVFSSKCLNKNFIDVGTNIGYYSLLAASFGHSVLSIEAMDYNLNVYRKSVAMNDFKNIVIEHAGVSDSSGGYLCMEMPEGNAGNGVATFSRTKCKNSVEVKTIDDITAGSYENTFAMKLDIEGFETRALLGAKKFIERVKPCYIWFEYVKEAVIRSGKNPNDIFIFLESLGYIIYDIATPETPVHSILSAAFLEARHESCPYSYMCHKPQTSIQTHDLFAAIDYNAAENKGPWKQGWDYDYDGRFKDGLTVHVVPHSHNDPGWIKTYHTYYSTQTRHILDTVVAALTEDPRRTFIWAEISYFSLWWNDASPQQKEQAKKLVVEKRLDFVTGGWVMNDEASVTARATRWHLQEGREWLQKTFGVTPQYSWAIDPFGHSAGQAQVLKELGYKGMLIQRVHYAVKKQLAQKQQLEFQWQTPAGEIFTHMMPFYSYDGPHTCGPDPSICCQFDFARIGKGKTWTGCPWGKMSVPITDANVAERSRTWLDQVYKKAMLYRGKHVLIPVGDDFRYQTMGEAHKQFTNYQKMFDWIKVNVPSLSISFSTLTRYFDAQRQTEVPKLQGSFFPYSDREKDYWTGYFNSRIFYKGYDRLLESLIAAVETKCPTEDIHLQKRALGIFQHHDGITGTAKSHVVQDYYKTMQNAVSELKSKLKTCLNTNTLTMGMAVNLPLLNITTFLDSLRSSGLMQPPNKVVLFSDKWTVQALSHKYSEVKWVLNNDNSNGFHPSNYRYYQYYSHILSSKPYTNMLIADVRDTYIMSNPFKTITEPDFVHAFLEENGHFLNSGDFNTIWIRKCYTNDMIKKIGSRPVSCSGVVLGGWEKMKEYLKLMTSELDSHRFCESNGIDKGIHNVLVYNKRRDLFKIHKNGGIVLTMGYMAKNNKILDSMAKSSILHQYDRHFLANQWILEDIKSKASIIYYNNGCNKNWLKTMGYTGECVQHDSIMESFERLHYDYKVTEKTPNCLAGQRNAILLVSSGHSVAKQFVGCFKKVYLLDWFGTSKDMTPQGVITLNAMRKGSGQFLGYTLQTPLKDTGVKPRRQAYGILLGKLPRYWVQKKHLLSKMPDVKFACMTCDIEMKNVVNHKRLPRGEYIKLTSEATFLLGAGHPIGSPSVLEALQCGLTIILPKMQHYKMGVTHVTQHDDIHAIMNEQPEVRKRICYYENDEKMVECVRNARKYPPLTLISYTRESFDMRMKTFFGQTNANGHVLVNPLSIDTPTMKADEIRPYEEDVCVPVPTADLQFVGIKLDEHGHVIQINETPVHESLVWRSNKPGPGVAGAYLMAVTGTKDILRPTKHTTCVTKQYKQAETKFDMLSRRIRVYNDGTIEFIYDADIRARNNGELWAVYKPEWSAERLCSDVHGLTWECHTERKDAPLQAKFWPMPTMAWLASSSERLTFTGAQPTGVGFHEGAMVLMLDRCGDQDDARGLGQGITDSRPVDMRFGVLMETESLKEKASEKALMIRKWMLNPEINIM